MATSERMGDGGPAFPSSACTNKTEREFAEWASLNPGAAYQLARWLAARLYTPERDALVADLLPLSSEWLRGARWAKAGCGVMAVAVLGLLGYVAWLSGPVERGHAVIAVAALAFLVFWEWRKSRRRKSDSCINCERDAQFCWSCCDAIGHDLWLWRDGDGFLAFSNEYPCYPDGDPMTAGEPAARAKFVASLPRAFSRPIPSEDEMLVWAAGWRSEDGEPEGLTTEQRMVWCIVRAIRREMTTNRVAARSQP